jgi:hypothetical protein
VKVVAPATGDLGLGLLDLLSEAAREFNRTLDIRLRFLDIGVDLIPVRPLRGQSAGAPEAWSTRVGQVLDRERPRILLLTAGDPSALPAAREAGRRSVRTVVLVPGSEDGAIAEIREACPDARAHDLGDTSSADEGRRLIEILVAERAGP